MQVNVKIKNLSEVRAALKKAPYIVPKYINKAIKKSILHIRWESQDETPVDTGNLKGTYGIKFGNLYAETGPNANYAMYVHEGTRPHYIGSPVKLSAKYGGKWVYIGNHPGTKANKFMERGVKKSENQVNKWFEQELNNALEQIAREAK